MQELRTTASLVEPATLEEGGSITAVLARSELEAALRADDAAQLWLELGLEEDEETKRLTIDVGPSDLEEILRLSSGDEVTLVLDEAALAGLFDDPDVEAHGMRGALAIAVTAAAFAAPAGLAAVPQTASAASTVQQASLAAKPQVSSAAAKAQVSSAAAKAQVSSAAAKAQVSKAAAKAQVSKTAAKAQVSKSLVVKASGLTLLRSGIVR